MRPPIADAPLRPAWRLARWGLARQGLAPEQIAEITDNLEEERHEVAMNRGRLVAAWWSWREALACARHTTGEATEPGATPAGTRWRSRLPGSRTDLRLALRLIARQPVLSATAVIALAVCIGLCVLGFSLYTEIVFGRLPFDDDGRFVMLEARKLSTLQDELLTPDEIETLARRASRLEALVPFQTVQENLEVERSTPEPIQVARLAPFAFAHVPTAPLLGRALIAADALPGAEPVVVLGETLWRDRLEGSGRALGATVRLGGVERRIVGVLPSDFGFPVSQVAWVPLVDTSDPVARQDRSLRAFGVLESGSRRLAAEVEVQAIARSMTDAREESEVEVRSYTLVPYAHGFVPPGFDTFLLAVVAILLLLLCVAAANVANLVLVRTLGRADELAMRAVLGASRAHLVLQIFLEVLVLAAVAAALGLAASSATLRWLTSVVDDLPYWVRFAPDLHVAAFAAGTALLGAFVAGALPALRATRGLSQRVRGSGEGASGARLGRIAGALIAAEIALAVGLLAGSALFGRGLLGFTTSAPLAAEDHVLTARVVDNDLPANLGPDPAATLRSFREAVERELAGVPGASSTAVSSWLPRQETGTETLELEAEPGVTHHLPAASVGPGFFEALQIRPLAGRTFGAGDFREGAPPVAIVNRPFADRLLRGRDPIGARFRGIGRNGPGEWTEIVGVVEDPGMSPADPRHAAGVLEPLVGSNHLWALLRSEGDPLALSAALRQAIARLDPEITVRDVTPLSQVGWEARTLLGAVASATLAAGAMTLVLALAGVYAILAFSLVRRTRELGIRMALGAGGRELLVTLLRGAAVQLALGLVAGAGIAFALSRATAVLPFAVDSDLRTLLPAVTAFVITATLGLSAVPARRALRLRPSEALANETLGFE